LTDAFTCAIVLKTIQQISLPLGWQGAGMSKLESYRKRRNQFFLKHPNSPLSKEQKDNFQGMNYFPENPDLDLVVEVERFDLQGVVPLETTTGAERSFTRYGRFTFEVEGQEVGLTIFSGEKGYLLPFKDSLAGIETYSIGRYVEIRQLRDGRFEINFNMAYNPFCAYGDGFSCIITPEENYIEVPLRAGEMLFEH
jgi:uncharacterized protein (DUF1684 family)